MRLLIVLLLFIAWSSISFGQVKTYSEIKKKGEDLVNKVIQINTKPLKEKKLNLINTAFLDSDTDIQSYALFDLEGRVIHPLSKLNEYIRTTFSVMARDWAIKTSQETGNTLTKKFRNGSVGVAGKISVQNKRKVSKKVIGVIAIIFKPIETEMVHQTTNTSWVKFCIPILIAAVIFGIISYRRQRS